MNKQFWLIGLSAIAVAGAGSYGFIGADSVLERLDTAAERATSGGGASEAELLNKEIKALAASKESVAPAVATRRWLVLFDRYAALDPSARNAIQGGNRTQGIPALLLALPGPDAWPELASQIAARPAGGDANPLAEQSLRLLAHTLSNDAAGQSAALSEFQKVVSKQPQQIRSGLDHVVQQMAGTLASRSGDPKAAIAIFEKQLTALESEKSTDRHSTLEIPDLVTLAGERKAGDLLRRALLQPRAQVSLPVGDATRALARNLALELVGSLKTPPWRLAQSMGAGELFEALDNKFPLTDDDKYDRQTAAEYYLLDLIAQSRTKDAIAFSKRLGAESESESITLPEAGMEALDKAGGKRQLADFLHDLLTAHPELPHWNQYIDLAVRSGKEEQMITLARAASATPGLSEKRQRVIQHNLAKALLAGDEVQEGAALLEKQLAEPLPKPGPNEEVEGQLSDRITSALTLARVGALAGHPEWEKAGLATARDSLAKISFSNRSYAARSIAGFLIESDKLEDAEALLVAELEKQAETPADPRRGRYDSASRELLTGLAGVYHRAGRHADVLALLDRSRAWGASDIAELLNNSSSVGKPLGHIAAVALAEAGRADDALRLTRAVLQRNGGYDPAYELLVKLSGDDAVAKLDALFARDRFEERPLIWKGHVLFEKGDIDAAEQSIREAIAIDPSDGEEPRGDRMRAYAVLAEILRKKGDDKTAEIMEGAVKAIRLSEDADRFYSAGLLSRAVVMYDEALGHFADAYCIQSRLALRLSELGRNEEAETHYRRAYELMPESFGRVESHCFGCERAFAGERAQGIAERVFMKIADATPDKPQVHYLLGYLREDQSRNAEALAHYEKAVALDPDYLNAWKRLAGLKDNIFVPQDRLDAAAINILRLDPLGRHATPDLDGVADLAGLWRAAEMAAADREPEMQELLPLPASKAAMDAAKAAAAAAGGYHSDRSSPAEISTAASTITGSGVIQQIAMLLEYSLAAEGVSGGLVSQSGIGLPPDFDPLTIR